jgi:hypothetical protein
MNISKLIDGIGALYLGILLTLFTTFLMGCSFQVGIDWHGETGVDKRVQTVLAKEDKPRAQSAVNKGGY